MEGLALMSLACKERALNKRGFEIKVALKSAAFGSAISDSTAPRCSGCFPMPLMSSMGKTAEALAAKATQNSGSQ
jgi:hypothetical protein